MKTATRAKSEQPRFSKPSSAICLTTAVTMSMPPRPATSTGYSEALINVFRGFEGTTSLNVTVFEKTRSPKSTLGHFWSLQEETWTYRAMQTSFTVYFPF